MLKLRVTLAVFASLAAVLALPAAAGTAPEPEFNVAAPAGAAVNAKFDFHGPVDVNHFYLSNPLRLVIDVTGAVISQGRTFPVSSTHVERVRIAQNSLDPDIVRIVLDMKKEFRPTLNISEAAGVIFIGETASNPFPGLSVKKAADHVQIVIPFSQKPAYHSERVEDPSRLVLDFPGFAPGKALSEVPVNDGIVKSVRVSQYSSDPDVTRVVVETTLPAAVDVSEAPGGKKIIITANQYSMKGKTVCVDPGHGGKDPGAQVPGVNEKDIVLDVALKLRNLLKAAGARVVMTRETDVFIPLKERAAIANRSNADVFVSVHANALENHKYRKDIRGIQVCFYGDRSRKLAEILRDSMAKTEAIGAWGVSERKKLVVLHETKMAAALTELGFMTHPDEINLLKDPTFRENAARGILNGLESHFGGRGPELAATELNRAAVASLPEKPFTSVYSGGGNVLKSGPSKLPQKVADVPDIPDFIDLLPEYEEGLTHEVGGAATVSRTPTSPGN